MNYKNIELDEDNDDSFVAESKRDFHFVITKMDALQFLQKQINTYRQFSKFPRHHKSFKSLQHTGAMYEFIFDQLNNS